MQSADWKYKFAYFQKVYFLRVLFIFLPLTFASHLTCDRMLPDSFHTVLPLRIPLCCHTSSFQRYVWNYPAPFSPISPTFSWGSMVKEQSFRTYCLLFGYRKETLRNMEKAINLPAFDDSGSAWNNAKTQKTSWNCRKIIKKAPKKTRSENFSVPKKPYGTRVSEISEGCLSRPRKTVLGSAKNRDRLCK